jgi:siroheme synthase
MFCFVCAALRDSITITVQATGIPLWIIGGITAAIAAAIAATILMLRKKRR